MIKIRLPISADDGLIGSVLPKTPSVWCIANLIYLFIILKINMVCLCFLLLSSLLLNNSLAWDTEQLEVFDVVDEVKKNFYELLNVSNDASSTEIRSAFRSLSLKLHPDKNLEKDTSEQFRNLVSVYEVLKSPSKRNYYNEVLVNGLPNWKSAMYYYRYVRKMGMSEACSILFIIITIGQYLVNWAAYFEKMFTINENLKRKKQFRKGKNIEDVYEIDYPSKPTFFNTLPFQIPKLIWSTTLSLPSAFGSIKRTVEQQIKDVSTIPGPQPPPPVKVKTVRKRNKFVVPEGPNFESSYTDGYVNGSTPLSAPSNVVGNLWSDDDLNELVRLVQKFPQGSSKRWEKISKGLGRSVAEVTYMANKMKENSYKLPSEEIQVPEIKVKRKTTKEVPTSDNITNWSQIQQKAFEEALSKYPKGILDRWDKISDRVPDKSKEECMLRFKYLAESFKKQKENPTTEFTETEDNYITYK